MPLLAIKMCCYFKNSDYLQKILELYSQFESTKDIGIDDPNRFDVKQVLSYDYLDGKRKLDIPNY